MSYIDRISLAASTDGADTERLTLTVERRAAGLRPGIGQGSGPIDAMVKAIGTAFRPACPMKSTLEATAAAPRRFLTSRSPPDRAAPCLGAGMHPNIITASLLAILSAVNRAIAEGALRARIDSQLTGT